MQQSLSETRKADRLLMANAVGELAKRFGAKASMSFEDQGSQGIDYVVSIQAPGELYTSVAFRKNSPHAKPNTFVLSWCLPPRSERKLDPAVFGERSVNKFHFAKATQVAYSFEGLCETLEHVLRCAQNGTAYQAAELHA